MSNLKFTKILNSKQKKSFIKSYHFYFHFRIIKFQFLQFKFEHFCFVDNLQNANNILKLIFIKLSNLLPAGYEIKKSVIHPTIHLMEVKLSGINVFFVLL